MTRKEKWPAWRKQRRAEGWEGGCFHPPCRAGEMPGKRGGAREGKKGIEGEWVEW